MIKNIIDNLSEIIAKIKPDIIHSHGATLALLVGIAAQMVHLKPVKILTHHSKKFTRLPSFLAVYLLNKYCDHLIAITQDKYNELLKIKFPLHKISLIPNFVDCNLINQKINTLNKGYIYQELNISPNNYVITMIGRLIPSKRFDKFIKILSYCSDKTKRKLVGLIIGDGPLKKKLEKLAKIYKKKVKIIFLGYQEDVYKYLAISNIFLFPSSQEVLPMVLIEASAAGVPIICSNISGNNDIVRNGYNGFLLNNLVEKEYSNYVLRILNHKNLAQKMSNNGIKIAREKFDKKVIIYSVISLYEKLLHLKNN